jgi:enoyl-[acyl-carrier protein] reductase I
MKKLIGKTYWITGIVDDKSLAFITAKRLLEEGASLVCTGLGPTPYHQDLSERSATFLNRTYDEFYDTIKSKLDENVLAVPLDASQQESVDDFARLLKEKGVTLDGFIHSIAMDKTVRAGQEPKRLFETTWDEFSFSMNVSAFSLIRFTSALIKEKRLNRGCSILSLSYLGSEKIMFHPYRNIGVSKAALERISLELAVELGELLEARVNVIRFSPYRGSKAGAASLTDDVFEFADKKSILRNAHPSDLAEEVVHLLTPGIKITGEIRHVDGGYNIRA